MRRLDLLTLLILLAVLVACGKHRPQTLYSLDEPAKVQDAGKGPLVSTVKTRINPTVLVPGKAVKIDFHVPGKTIVLELEPLSPESLALPEGQHAWAARLPGGDGAFFVLIGDFVEARVQLGHTVYRLRSMTPKMGVLETFDAQQFPQAPDDSVVGPDATGGDGGAAHDSSCEDPPGRVDVMVLYTPAAREAAGGETQIENGIWLARNHTHDVYGQSGVAHLLHLVHIGQVPGNYTEPEGGVDPRQLFDQLSYVDGVIDEIHELRDTHGADLVSLIFQRGNLGVLTSCGYGSQVETADADATKDKAFSVVRRWCVAENMDFAHETGHNLGANHDRAKATSSLNYNFGHIQPLPPVTGEPGETEAWKPWRTIMTYDQPCASISGQFNCSRKPYFSNPDVSIDGVPTGVPMTEPEPEHNVAVFALNHEEVGRYRCRGSDAPAIVTPANVWMKDLWEDEGREPDPASVGQPMWKSPYIWVRRNEDMDLVHEYDHEDPQQGQTNYVYVKMHNTGGASESAALELYFANASTNLDDPGSWTPIDSQSRTIEPGGDVAKFEWPGVPATGHYCLLARWNTDGTPLAFTSLDEAVRADNDLIWRNVNVIDLAGPPQTNAMFAMVGDRRSRETYLLIDTKPLSRREIDWPQLAGGSIRVDAAKLDSRRLRVAGLRQTGRGEFEFALGKEAKLIGPFVLGPRETTQVTLTTNADPAAVKRESEKLANPAHYDVTVMQVHPDGVGLAANPSALFQRRGLVIGGVTYTLRVPAGQ
jgi:hypothetical protein